MTKPEIERAIMTPGLWVSVLPWRNDPHVYVWNRTARPVSIIEHRLWFENRQLKLEDEPIFSYHADKLFIGIARIDKVDEDTLEVSLLVNPDQRGRGYGKQILGDMCEYFLSIKPSDWSLIAVIHKDNLISKSLFTGLGFTFLSENKVFNTFVFSRV